MPGPGIHRLGFPGCYSSVVPDLPFSPKLFSKVDFTRACCAFGSAGLSSTGFRALSTQTWVPEDWRELQSSQTGTWGPQILAPRTGLLPVPPTLHTTPDWEVVLQHQHTFLPSAIMVSLSTKDLV